MSKPRIGFVGVGFMGHGMAKNIVEKGHALTVLGHRNRAPVDDLVARGAKEVKTAKDLAAACDIVFLCVTGSPQVEAVTLGDAGLVAGATKGVIVCDTSTADPFSTIRLAETVAAKGVTFCDAPLGGTPAQAETGELSTMVGADEATFASLKPVLECFAKRVVHVGPVGTGHKMKLLNNFLSLGYAAIYAEALAIGAKAGVSVETFDSVLRGSRMDCGFYQTFFGWALERNPNAHLFTLDNALKDLRYVVGMGDQGGAPTPISGAMKALYQQAIATTSGSNYVPTLADAVAKVAGTKLSTDKS